MGTFGKRSRGEGNKLFLEYSATRLVQLPPLPNAGGRSGDVCCLVFSKKTGMFQRTEVTTPRNCLRCKCCKIEKLCCFVGFFCFLFLTCSTLCVAQWDSFSGGWKTGCWLLANIHSKVS